MIATNCHRPFNNALIKQYQLKAKICIFMDCVFYNASSTIIQLVQGSQFYWWGKLEKTIDLLIIDFIFIEIHVVEQRLFVSKQNSVKLFK